MIAAGSERQLRFPGRREPPGHRAQHLPRWDRAWDGWLPRAAVPGGGSRTPAAGGVGGPVLTAAAGAGGSGSGSPLVATRSGLPEERSQGEGAGPGLGGSPESGLSSPASPRFLMSGRSGTSRRLSRPTMAEPAPAVAPRPAPAAPGGGGRGGASRGGAGRGAGQRRGGA